MKQQDKTLQIAGVEITISEHGSISFKNDENNFWVCEREIMSELNGDRFFDSLRFACKLLSISTPIELLNTIGYKLTA